MNIEKKQEGSRVIFILEGRLDTTTSPKLEDELKKFLNEGITKLVFDFASLEYLSSAGLRILLATQKYLLKKQGEMIVRNVNETVAGIFDVTGFTDILTIE